ncbi:carbohydrate ABC transporter permease [Cryobacterium sp. TMT2-15-1]|uniref:carbohydrate ABC transporter permease n=1 Tax=Cryobacterium sp. TMT2-15-1 TaxID=1259246 RepID=UPI00106CB595|nr:carbohydrate ABC transporter permease [Cryobacterium sp. TMT2-15-1]TFC55795.1 carbohydrate ABC transporter permease [Cryobacterium sp. TMT2-15-1]
MHEKLAFRSKLFIVLFLALVALAQLVPFWMAITTATKPADDLSSVLLPTVNGIEWSNFSDALRIGNILRAISNTAFITVVSTTLVCVLGATSAYPLARRLTRFNGFVAAGILSLIMIPPLSILVPLYSLLSQIGGLNTYWGQILVMVAGGLPLSIFLYTAFLRSIPESLDEAARIDGANMIQTFFHVIFPLLKPVTATVVILTGVQIWNDYAMSNYILTDPVKQTVAPAVAAFFAQQASNRGAGAAAALISVVPILIAYLFLQRYFMRGLVAGAEK